MRAENIRNLRSHDQYCDFIKTGGSLVSSSCANSKSWLIVLLFFFGLLLLAFAFQGSRGFFAPDEGIHADIAQAMLDTQDWLIPRVEHEVWLDKPPLSLWAVAAGMRLFGHNEWGARFFHGLCFAMTAMLVFALGRSMGGRRHGWLGATIYATMVIPFAAGNVITPDTPLTLWTTASFLCFWKSVEPGARLATLWKMLMCATFGLGFLTKGPAALIPPGAMLVFLLLQRRLWQYLLTPWTLAGLGLFCALGLGWYVYVAQRIPGALAYFWDNQVFGRLVSEKYDRNSGWTGMLVYVPVVLLGTLPWSLAWWRSLKRSGGAILGKSFWIELHRNPCDLLLTVWIVVPLLIFCTASSRLPLYLLPIFPAFALLCARLWPLHRRRDVWLGNPLAFSRGMLIALGVWMVALVGPKFGAAHCSHEKDMRAFYALIADKLPDEPYEIVCIKEHWEGLGFYDGSLVERVTDRETPYPLFMLPENLSEEVEEMRTSKYTHILLCRKAGRASLVREALRDANVAFEESALPFRRYMFVCAPARQEHGLVRLIALGDTGKDHVPSIADVLFLSYAEKTFDDGVLLLGDNLQCESERTGCGDCAAREQFEVPFADLLREGVPFFAVLGNHDYDPGIKEFELEYPLFHMNGRRYYSQSFGSGLVESFMLDSITLVDDPEQIGWLERSLAESKAVWKIVMLHHPLYSTAMRHPPDQDLRELIEPILRKHGVSIVLQGHNHIYERLSPVHGITYVTAGSGGTVNMADLKPNAAQRIAGNDQTEVFVMLEFDDSACHLTAYDVLGSVIDETTMANGPNVNLALRVVDNGEVRSEPVDSHVISY